jgi:hypothetical protein
MLLVTALSRQEGLQKTQDLIGSRACRCFLPGCAMISHGGNPFQVICDETPDNDFPPHFLFLQEFSPFRPPFSLDEADLVSTNGTSHRP